MSLFGKWFSHIQCNNCNQPINEDRYPSMIDKKGNKYCNISCFEEAAYTYFEPEFMNHDMCYCDGCGEDYPRTHLIYQYQFDGNFCERCYTHEEEAE